MGAMAQQVRATYDFDAQPGSGELTIREGELLTVIRDGIDGGWLEGKNAKGKVGLFPESYVARMASSSLSPAIPPPSLPSQSNVPIPSGPNDNYSLPPTTSVTKPPLPAVIGGTSAPFDPWNDSTVAPSYIPPSSSSNAHSVPSVSSNSVPPSVYPTLAPSGNNHVEDDFDDEWTEDDEEPGDAQRVVSRSRSAGPDTTSLSSRQGAGGGAARMKNINRFSNFVKTGMESFILATSKMNNQPTHYYEIIWSGDQIRWAPPSRNYTCIVDKPKKESKLKGLKSFIAYSVTSSLTGIQVSRRYKHFDWLHEQLTNKFLLIPSPPLPEKQVAGRYEEDLIEHRKVILQLWVTKICRHPVMSESEVWMHFMNCTDEKKWKAGKRQAEKDEFVGGNFFHSVRVPAKPLDSIKIEQQVENFSRCIRSMDDSVRILYDRISESQKRLLGPYKSNWQKTAAAFDALGQSFELDQSSGGDVGMAIKESAHVLHKIGIHHEEHGKRDMEQLMDWLYTYKGLLGNIPEMVNVQKSALAKLRDNERLQSENKLGPQEAEAIRQRVDVVSYAMMAEITQLNEERNDDFRQMLGQYFEQQAAFYNKMSQQFSQLAQRFRK